MAMQQLQKCDIMLTDNRLVSNKMNKKGGNISYYNFQYCMLQNTVSIFILQNTISIYHITDCSFHFSHHRICFDVSYYLMQFQYFIFQYTFNISHFRLQFKLFILLTTSSIFHFAEYSLDFMY